MSHKHLRFGKYLLLENISTSIRSDVFLARTLAVDGLNKFFIIKRLRNEHNQNKEMIQTFKDEAKIAVNFSHSNVANVYEYNFEEGFHYVVMDYIEGFSLEKIILDLQKSQHRFSIPLIIYIVKEIAAGLNHLHSILNPATGQPFNIFHSQINPQNIMLSFDGAIKIIDFGLKQNENYNPSSRGERGYLSPEQLTGIGADQRSDLFSLGAILCELLEKNRTLDNELKKITSVSVSKDINLRFQTALEFQRELNIYLNLKYPDFSSQDLGEFIKIYYAEEYKEQRAKLIEYTNIGRAALNYEISKVPDIYEHTHTHTYTNTIYPRSRRSERLEMPDGFDSITKVNIHEAKNHDFEKLIKSNPFATKKASEPAADMFRLKTARKPVVEAIPPTLSSEANSFPFASLFLKAVFIGSLIILAINGKKYFNFFELEKKPIPLTPPIELSSVTPNRVLDNRDGSYSKKIIEEMRKSKKIAYLNIKISNPHIDDKIFINGEALIERAPVSMFPVLAGEDNIVSVFNSSTNKFAVKKINLQAGTLGSIVLRLKSGKH